MKLSIWSRASGNKLFEMEHPENDSFFQAPSNLNFQFEKKELQGHYTGYQLGNMLLGYGNFSHAEPIDLEFESEVETVELHFKLAGRTETCDRSRINYCQFDGNQQNLMYAAGFRGYSTIYAQQNTEFFEINFRPQDFLSYLPREGHLFDQFRNQIERGSSALLLDHNPAISPRARVLIQDLIHCQRTGVYRQMLVESRVLELLMLQFEAAESAGNTSESVLSKAVLEKMHFIREFISQHTDEHFTLQELARKVGTNVFTLKQGFKQAFGTTVFGYWNCLRMAYARRLLLDGRLPIKVVAEKVGYKHPQHFSTAFKKHFGVSPSKLLA